MSDITASMNVQGVTSPKVRSLRKGRKGLSRLLSKATPVTWVVFAAALFTLVAAAVGPALVPYDPDAQTLLARLRPPLGFDRAIASHPLGTDELGRDMLSRTLHGLRLTLLIALTGSIISLVVGALAGILAGYLRGVFPAVIMAVVDIQIAVPFTLIALLVVAIFGNSLPVLITVIGLSGWEVYARVVRAQVLTVSRQPFVEAARAAGASHLRILFRHVLPNVVSPIIVVWTMTFSGLILLESSLSFLGLGVQPPTATLGSMVGSGRDYLATNPWIAVVPSLAIMFVSLLVLLIGDWLRDALDVKLK
ncbi:MAG: ABC transporter permease [Pseudorhizobium sp.]